MPLSFPPINRNLLPWTAAGAVIVIKRKYRVIEKYRFSHMLKIPHFQLWCTGFSIGKRYLPEPGKILGRPPGSRNKAARKLDAYKDQIEKYLKMGLSISAMRKIINSQLEKALSYSAHVLFINSNGELAGIVSKK